MWSIVYFLTDNSVEPVPSYWLNNEKTKCAWPNNDALIYKYRANKTKPNTFDFTMYDCRVLSSNILSLSEAQEKTKLGLYTSDLDNSDEKNETTFNKAKVSIATEKKNKYFKPSVPFTETSSIVVKKRYNTSEDSFNEKKKKTKVTEKKSLYDSVNYNGQGISEKLTICDADFDNDYNENEDDINLFNADFDNTDLGDLQKIIINNEQNGNSNNESNTEATVNRITPITLNTMQIQTHIETPNNIHSPDINMNSVQDISTALAKVNSSHRTIINYLAYLKVELCKVSDRQQELNELFLNSKSNISETIDNINIEDDYFINNWPISDTNGLFYIEDKMKNDNNFKKQVVRELARTGGRSLTNMIYKIMKKVFADEILSEYTYYGLRNKKKFFCFNHKQSNIGFC